MENRAVAKGIIETLKSLRKDNKNKVNCIFYNWTSSKQTYVIKLLLFTTVISEYKDAHRQLLADDIFVLVADSLEKLQKNLLIHKKELKQVNMEISTQNTKTVVI